MNILGGRKIFSHCKDGKEIVRMKRESLIITTLVLFALLLTACGGQETATSAPSTNVPPATMEATSTSEMTATEAPTSTTEANMTATPGIPVTGESNPSQRVTDLIGSPICGTGGDQLATASDLVLDFDQAKLTYVIADANGKSVAIPYPFLTKPSTGGTGTESGTGTLATDTPSAGGPGTGTLATDTPAAGGAGSGTLATDTPSAGSSGTGTLATDTPSAGGAVSTATSTTGTGSSGAGATGQQSCLTLTISNDLFNNAPAFDTTAMPGKGQAATDWDTNIMLYWLGGEPSPTSTPAASGTGSETTPSQGIQPMAGVILASDVLGANVVLNTQGAGTGTGTGTESSTSTPSAGGSSTATPEMTATASSSGTGPGTGTGSTTTEGSQATVQDVVFDPKLGDLQYLVVSLGSTDTWTPVPVDMVGWDASNNQLALMVDASTLQNAPSFSSSQFPDTSTSGWDQEFSSFWSSNSGTGAIAATATP